MSIRLVYAVTWRYCDGSASGVVSVHPTEAAAKQMVALLATHGDGMKRFAFEPVPYED